MLNSEINEQLAGAADVREGDVVLEIGPGTGSLTSVLLQAGAIVLGVEKDPHMADLVRERFSGSQNFTLLTEDILLCNIRSHMSALLESSSSAEPKPRFAKVVANIPFNISAEVIKLLLPMGDIFSEVVLLLQDETALRVTEANLRTSEYRSINIFVNFYSDPKYNSRVSKRNFFPQPTIDAAIVTFKLKQASDYPSVSSTKSFFSMVNTAFDEKRKMLRKTLQHMCSSSEIQKALESIGVPPTARPEELTMENFVSLHNFIAKS